MSMANRDQAIIDFQEKPGVNILIVSLKAAALGLNLVAANHVVLLDLVIAPAGPSFALWGSASVPECFYLCTCNNLSLHKHVMLVHTGSQVECCFL